MQYEKETKDQKSQKKCDFIERSKKKFRRKDKYFEENGKNNKLLVKKNVYFFQRTPFSSIVKFKTKTIC